MREITEKILFGKDLPKARRDEMEFLLVGAFKDFVATVPKWNSRAWGSQAAIARFWLWLLESKPILNDAGEHVGLEPIGPWFDSSSEERAYFAGRLVNASQFRQDMAKPGMPLADKFDDISYTGS